MRYTYLFPTEPHYYFPQSEYYYSQKNRSPTPWPPVFFCKSLIQPISTRSSPSSLCTSSPIPPLPPAPPLPARFLLPGYSCQSILQLSARRSRLRRRHRSAPGSRENFLKRSSKENDPKAYEPCRRGWRSDFGQWG